ncbi:MAG: ATP-binding protein [Akkermansiaceae bacterium]|jgi:two-component system phosphate regulon sensor histidine kinase PhoR
MTDYYAIIATLIVIGGFIIHAYRVKSIKRAADNQVSDLKNKHENDLNQAEDERNHLLDALGDAFIIVDSEANIRFANAMARELFSGRELVGRKVREAFLDPRLAEALLQCLETGEPVQQRVVLPQQTSPLGDLETRGMNAWLIDAAQLTDSSSIDKRDTRVVIRDITSEYQLEQIRKDFVANASHELRTPLAIISGYLENLLDGGMLEDQEMSKRFLSVMQKHAERISRIVEEMLVISKLESGESSAIKIEPFKIHSCINDVLERLESVIQNQQALVSVNMRQDNLILNGDRFYWTQVLFNLIENALKQNPFKDLKIEVGAEEVDKYVRIWVSDNGVGIPSADLPHIFRRFYRVEKHHSQMEIKGTGLGLSIVKRAIEAHQGTITVSSTPGRETKFLMTIPKERV